MIWIVLKWCADRFEFIALGIAILTAVCVWMKRRIDLDYAPRRRLIIRRLDVDHLVNKNKK